MMKIHREPKDVRDQLMEAYQVSQQLKDLSDRLVVVTEEAAKSLGLPLVEGRPDARDD